MDSTFEKLGGEIRYLRRLVDKEDKLWSAFNPSIGINPFKGYGITFRSSNYVILPHGELATTYGNKIRNRVWFADLDDDLQLQNLRQIDFSQSGWDMHRGVEDAKLLSRDGKWMFTAVAMERNIPMARYCECYLDKSATSVEKDQKLAHVTYAISKDLSASAIYGVVDLQNGTADEKLSGIQIGYNLGPVGVGIALTKQENIGAAISGGDVDMAVIKLGAKF